MSAAPDTRLAEGLFELPGAADRAILRTVIYASLFQAPQTLAELHRGLLGVRRTLCLNYIVDEAQLALPERDLFTAAEIVGLRPLAGAPTYRLFIEANRSLAERYPNFLARQAALCRRLAPAGAPRWLEALLELGPAPLLEAAARLLLGRRLRRKLGDAPGVDLSPHRLKLHSQDHRPRVGAAFADALRRYGLDADGMQA